MGSGIRLVTASLALPACHHTSCLFRGPTWGPDSPVSTRPSPAEYSPGRVRLKGLSSPSHHQYLQMRDKHYHLQRNDILLVIDFSEKYATKYDIGRPCTLTTEQEEELVLKTG